MSQPAIPVATAYQPPAQAVAPISAAEVASLAGRMRVEARLPRIALVGGVLGFVCGCVTLWPFLSSDLYLVNAMTRGGLSGWTAALIPLILSGLLLLLAFYSLRLQFQSANATFGAVEDNLGKIRWVLAGCMVASLISVAGVLSNPERASDFFLAGLYATCCTACGVVVCDVRKGLGEFETPEQRRRRKMARGFEVEMRSAVQVTQSAAPVAVLPLDAPAPPLPYSSHAPTFNAPAMSTAMREALPLTVQPPIAQPVWGAQHAERDLRTILHLLAGIGMALYTLRIPQLANVLNYWQSLQGRPGGPFASTSTRTDVIAFLTILDALIVASGIAWVVWGVIVLAFGARLRVWIFWLAAFSLASLGVYSVTYIWLAVSELGQSSMGRAVASAGFVSVYNLVPRMAELIFALIMVVMLTRPRVKDLFEQGSETGEGVETVITRVGSSVRG